jgi:asparagine synthase (glutamine-hydrolysing)
MFMRLGIWPVSPLVHPTIVDFCRALPRSIRHKRLLNLLALARAGLSDGFILPRLHENFANCIIRETWMIDFDEMFSDSPIADFGIARVDALLNSVRNLETPPPIELVGKLFAYRQLDGVLKTYL